MVELPEQPPSEADAADPELEAALEPFLDWARAEAGLISHPVLPPLGPQEGLTPGASLGDYELVRRLGLGGMGIVFEAKQHSVLGRSVALKALRSTFATKTLSRRFLREIAAIAELDHPVIVPVVDACTGGSTPFYVMKFVEGLSAARLIRELKERPSEAQSTAKVRNLVESCSTRPTNREEVSGCSSDTMESSWEEPYQRWVARLGMHLAEALQYAHEHGFVHRDVKPGNIMVTRQGRPVLLDFGLASNAADETLTRPGEFLGTVAYAAPEQVRGEQVDTRCDVYSLGATLYELLTLRRPFDAESRAALARQIEEQEPASMGAAVASDLRTIVMCALAKSAARRYATPGALAFDLREYLAGRAVRARPPGAIARALRWIRRYPRLVTAVAAILLTWIGLRVTAYREASNHVNSGRNYLLRYQEQNQVWAERLAEYGESVVANALTHQELRDLREDVRNIGMAADGSARDAERETRRAFDHVGGFGPAREQLAKLSAERLRRALRLSQDVLRREELRETEAILKEFDVHDTYADLLDHSGSVRFDCRAEPVQVELRRDLPPGEVVFSGWTPTSRILVTEGSYIARISRPGESEVMLPVCVRRDACYEQDPGTLPLRELVIELPEPQQLIDGFVFVHGGDTLLEDDPPRWSHVASFQIMRHEVTNGQYLQWLDKLVKVWHSSGPAKPPNLLERNLPRFGIQPYMERAAPEAGGAFGLRAGMGVELGHPVRGLTPMEIQKFSDQFGLIQASGSDDHMYSLASVAELTRAARGADGRRFTWGDVYRADLCANYRSGGFYGRDAAPLVVQSFATDVSPFGVWDLAGSVQEATRDLVGPVPNRYAVFGGSYRSDREEELSTTRVEAVENRPNPMVGVRLVLRALPDWMAQPDLALTPFEDSFDRSDSEQLGNGWQQVVGSNPIALRTNPTTVRNSSIESGRLICTGGLGHSSEPATVWRRVHLSKQGYKLRAMLRGRPTAGQVQSEEPYDFGLSLVRGFLASDDSGIQLALRFDGVPLLQYSSLPEGVVLLKGDARFSPERFHEFEIEVRGQQIAGRIWPQDTPRPAEPSLLIEWPGPIATPRFVGLHAPPAVGARVEVDWIRVEPRL